MKDYREPACTLKGSGDVHMNKKHTLASCSADSFPSCEESNVEVRAGRAVEGIPPVTVLEAALGNIAYNDNTTLQHSNYAKYNTCKVSPTPSLFFSHFTTRGPRGEYSTQVDVAYFFPPFTTEDHRGEYTVHRSMWTEQRHNTVD